MASSWGLRMFPASSNIPLNISIPNVDSVDQPAVRKTDRELLDIKQPRQLLRLPDIDLRQLQQLSFSLGNFYL